MSKVDITTPAEAAKKEALRVQILTNPATSTDRTGYTMALSMFKKVCMDVRQLLGIPKFRGGFDEWAELAMDSTLSENAELQILARRGEALNALITYEAKKLGIVPPNWWKECWTDELDVEVPTPSATDSE